MLHLRPGRRFTPWRIAAAILSLSLAHGAPALAAPPATVDGTWDATVRVKDTDIPFKLQLSGAPDHVKATFFDGERPVNASTGGSLKGDQLHVAFASYASALDARLADGVLRGTIGGLPFEGHRHHSPATSAAKAPSIDGVWEIPVDTPKGEKAWRLIVRQRPAGVYATILRIDGDTGTISGGYADGAFHLSRFAGERPTSLVISPQGDGSLGLVLTDFSGRRELKALRPDAARTAGLAGPTDPTRHTAVRDTKERFRFSGVDLTGRTVTNSDPRFKGKVVLVNIMGSWCPNCHDEAPFLAALDAKYRARGLEIVGLDFENADQLKSLDRLKAFIARYQLRYNILVGGERSEVNDRLPQAVNLNAWPTTFFLDRQGRVHSVHTGFPSRGSGAYEVEARSQITREVEALLAAKSAPGA